MYDLLSSIDDIRLNFSDGGLLYMNVTLACIMFGVALDIKAEQFRHILMNPKSAFLGIGSQFILLPALTFGLVMLLNPPPSVAMGMILIAACPGGNISNFISSLGKANVALSVSLTAFATLSATLLTPLNFAIWGGLYVKYQTAASTLNIPIRIE
ncbi:MAG: bile acid:sodium symporter family protein, partial [Bacteroidales bacterium]|nr:bile acid:sodium symporter family protein [Bacteroidales bacterium]